MSNTICVNKNYYAFKIENDEIFISFNDKWIKVVKTDKKNKYGDFVFQVVKEEETTAESFPMVQGEGAGQYTFDVPADTQLALF